MMKKRKKKSPTEPLDERDTRLRIFSDCRDKYGPEAERQLKMVFEIHKPNSAGSTEFMSTKHCKIDI